MFQSGKKTGPAIFQDFDERLEKQASQHASINVVNDAAKAPPTDTISGEMEMEEIPICSKPSRVRFNQVTQMRSKVPEQETKIKTEQRKSTKQLKKKQTKNDELFNKEELTPKSILKSKTTSKSINMPPAVKLPLTQNGAQQRIPVKAKTKEESNVKEEEQNDGKSPFMLLQSNHTTPRISFFNTAIADIMECRCRPGTCVESKTNSQMSMNNINSSRSEVDMDMINRRINRNAGKYIKLLEEFVRVKSISSQPKYLREMKLIMAMTKDYLVRLKFVLRDLEYKEQRLCPKESNEEHFIFASNFSSPRKNTMLIYTYLDVFPADQNTGWLSDPFILTANDGMLIGRGVSAGKGPLICWLSGIEAWQEEFNGELPVNIKFIIETRRTQFSPGLRDCIKNNMDFVLDVDVIIMLINSWFNETLPILHCSLGGWIQFVLELHNASTDLDSGSAGGIVYESMTQLCHLMNSLISTSGKINIPQIGKEVQSLHSTDYQLLEAADFSLYDYKERLGVRKVPHETGKKTFLYHRWCKPSLTTHGVEGAYSGRNDCRIIPGRVRGRFSIKLVPYQTVSHVVDCTHQYLHAQMRQMEIKTYLSLSCVDSSEPIIFDANSPGMLAAARAMWRAHGIIPPRSVGIPHHSPVANMLIEIIGKQTLMLPFSSFLDRRQTCNEMIPEKLFIKNIKMVAAIMFEIGNVPVSCKCTFISDYCMKTKHDRMSAEDDDDDDSSERLSTSRTFSNRYSSPQSKNSLANTNPSIMTRHTKKNSRLSKASLITAHPEYTHKKKHEKKDKTDKMDKMEIKENKEKKKYKCPPCWPKKRGSESETTSLDTLKH